MKHVYEVYVHSYEQKRNYNFGKVWTSREKADEYASICNDFYRKCDIKKVAYVQTLDVIE